MVEIEQGGAAEHVLDDAVEGALDFVVARAALMDHLADLGGQLVGSGFGGAEIVLEFQEAFELGGLGLHEGEMGAVLVDLALEVLEFLQAVGAAENLQDVLAAVREGDVGLLDGGDFRAEGGGAVAEGGVPLGEDAAVELDEVVVVPHELIGEGELGLAENALDVGEVEVDVVLQSALDLGEVVAGVIE